MSFAALTIFYIDLQGIKERRVLEKWLPKETIRIEDDLDIVRTQLLLNDIFKFPVTYFHIISCKSSLPLRAEKVTYLPPIGVSVGDKLWFAKDKAYLLPMDSMSQKNEWADHVWFNLRLFETILSRSNGHRIISYVNKLEQLVGDRNAA